MFSLATVHIFWAGFWPGGHVKHADNVGVEKQRESERECTMPTVGVLNLCAVMKILQSVQMMHRATHILN